MDTPLDGLTMATVDIGAIGPMEDGPTTARGRLMLILSMDMVTTLDTTVCLTMVMVDNGDTGLMEDGQTMARGLLMLSLLPRLMLIPTMDTDTALATMATLTMVMVETSEETTEDTGGIKITHYYTPL